MGWRELRARAKQFQQQTDAALANDIKQDTLLSRAKVTRRRSYDCVSETNSSPPSVGMEVRLIDMHDRIDVYVNNQPVGQVDTARQNECASNSGLLIAKDAPFSAASPKLQKSPTDSPLP